MTQTTDGAHVVIRHVSTVALMLASLLPAGKTQAALRGDIHEDTVWEGVVRITADVTISGATVRVMPGTRIIFDKPATLGTDPLILLNSPVMLYSRVGRTARLVLAGTPKQPIIIETASGKLRGAIVAGRSTSASVFARHVIFRNLGGGGGHGLAKPAFHAYLGGDQDDFWLSDCVFEDSGPLDIQAHSASSTVHIARCSFVRTAGNCSLSVMGASLGPNVITANRADAVLRIGCSQTLISENILVGPTAGLRLPGSTIEAVNVTGNYVHCTSLSQWGSSALVCDAPGVLLKDNVLRGGTYVVQGSPATVTGNVLVAADNAVATTKINAAGRGTTVSILANCPPETVLTDNLFVGGAKASLMPGRLPENLQVIHNVFDGWRNASRAIEFHAVPHRSTGAVIERNTFVRFHLAPVSDAAGRPGTVLRASNNLFVECPTPAYENVAGLSDFAPGDTHIEQWEKWGGRTMTSAAWADEIEQLLLAGSITPAEARLRWFEAYRPATASHD